MPLDNELFEVNSKTSLFDSPYGKVDQLPLSLQHSKLRKTENRNPEAQAQKDRISNQATESLESTPKRVPIKVQPRQKLETSPGCGIDSWTKSNHPSKKLEQNNINTNSKLNSETAMI